MPQKTELLEVDLFNMKPIPGSSLTEEPGKRPYERPPQIVEADKALQYCLNGMLGDTAVREELFDVLDMGISVETVASAFTLQAFSEGVFDPNIAETIKRPLMQFITQEASRAGIEDLNVVNEDIPKTMQMDNKLQIMQSLHPEKFKKMQESDGMDEDMMMAEEQEDDMDMEGAPMSEGFINRNSMEMM
tara:strand:- start:7259 stop:7825 length:567 start_codon:yes stop_codon:yes gene_type:complete